MARVVLERLTKIFSGHNGQKLVALRDISLAVAEQELLVVVGPSGCGKTTLLRLIAGLEEPTSGKLWMEDQRGKCSAPEMHDIAMVFQNPALYPHMSVYENMAFGLKLRRCSRLEIERRVGEAAELLGLGQYLQLKPMSLSSGQRQRVAIGRAIVRQPKLLLYDEPLSNLDPHMRNLMRREIARLHERLHATTIYVTHDQQEAMSVGMRVAVLSQGVLHQINEPLSLYQRPMDLFVAGFFGAPSMNFFDGTLALSGKQMEFVMEQGEANERNGTQLRLPIAPGDDDNLEVFAGRKVILGIRPEHICPRLAGASSTPPEQIIVARINRTERFGGETHLHLAQGSREFVARIPGEAGLQTRSTLELEFKMVEAHFFDPSSGKRIGSKESMNSPSVPVLPGACAC
jgi:multiple sugar transport system ATP-binding protein